MPDSADLAITNVRAPLGDAIRDDVTVVVVDGVITSVDVGGPAPAGAVDGHGLLLMPGLVDSHSDGLEKEISPRRTAVFPVDYAIGSFEGRLRSAGVTTVFHGLAYQHKPRHGRSVERAREIFAAIDDHAHRPEARVDHRVLYRFEARDDGALTPLLDDLAASRARGDATPLVSFEDHTPGQGQYRDVKQFEAAIDPTDTPDGVSVSEYVAQIMAEAEQLVAVRHQNLDRLGPLARGGQVRLLAHDAEKPEDVAAAHEAGATIAEFPVTVESAREARERGMAIVMGAPNALRGGSHSGNTSARELVEAGLCDVIASDYMPTALLASAFVMAAEGCCSLPAALRLVTEGPAEMAGLVDRGRLTVGARADLALVDDRDRWPVVVGTWRAADDVSRRLL